MKRLMLFYVGLILLSSQILLAQAVWQDEVVVRKQEFIDWGDAYSNNNDSFATTSNNDVIVLLSKGSYANQGYLSTKLIPRVNLSGLMTSLYLTITISNGNHQLYQREMAISSLYGMRRILTLHYVQQN